MSLTIEGYFDGEVIIPDAPVDLRPGERVEIKVKALHSADQLKALWERELRFIQQRKKLKVAQNERTWKRGDLYD